MDHSFLKNSVEADPISALMYLLQLSHSCVQPEQFKHLLFNIHQCLAKSGFSHQTNVLKLLKSIEKQDKRLCIDNFQVYYRDNWFTKLVLLSSLKHCTMMVVDDPLTAVEVLKLAIKTFSPVHKESLHLLKVVTSLLNSLKPKIDDSFSVELFNFAQVVALSPHKFFKQYAEEITLKTLQLSSLTILKQVQCLNFLPFKGVSISALDFLLINHFNNKSPQLVVSKVIDMFSNNIENHEGGSLYKMLLTKLPSCNITAWEVTVWPQFYVKLKHLDCQGEFFQSLLKYWIPITLRHYKLYMCNFLCQTSIPMKIKGNVLLESRRIGIVAQFMDNHLNLLKSLFANAETKSLAFQIVITPSHKKSICPSIAEVSLVMEYLEEASDCLSSKQLEALQTFCASSLALHAKYMSAMFKLGMLMLKTPRSELGAQILIALLHAANKCDKSQEESYFYTLVTDEKFKAFTEQVFLDFCASGEYLVKLVVLVEHNSATFTNDFLLSFINKLSDNLSIQASNSVKNVTFCVATINAKVDPTKNKIALQLLFSELFEIFYNRKLQISDLFKATLLFESVCSISKQSDFQEIFSDNSHWVCNVCFPRVARILSQEAYREEQGINSCGNRTEKTLEALYNILCEFLMDNASITTSADFPLLTASIIEVIQHSSMRRPTTTSAMLLERLFSYNLDRQDLKDLKIQILSDTIIKLKDAVSVQNVTIRRNPETRLIIHALCTSDFTPQKTLLNLTLRDLLQILNHEDSYTDATISSTLHCLEILMSDNTLYVSTLKYAPEAILQCVRHFKNQNWVVRNACIQLEKALIDRFLGVHISYNNRAKSVEDLFQLFPQLMPLFYKTLVHEPKTDSVLAVMQFFSESQIKAQPFPVTSKLNFSNVFLDLVGQKSNLYGIFAARSFLSLCRGKNIPSTIENIVQNLLDNFNIIRQRNVLRNYLELLQELNDKYQKCVSNEPELKIQQKFTQLTGFLSKFNLEQFDCLLVKVLPTQEVLAYLEQPKQLQRISLHNYIPYLLVNSSPKDLPQVLESVLHLNLPECLQVKVLSIIDRYQETISFQLVEILLWNSLQLSGKYVLMCYFKTVLLLFERCVEKCVSSKLLNKVRQNYKSNQEIYKTSIILLILSEVKEKSDADRHFIKSAVKHFTTLPPLTDEDVVEDVSQSLKYLYLNSFCLCDKKRILKLSLKLLLQEGKFHFITFAAKVSLPSPRAALKIAFSYNFLIQYFDSDIVAYDFVKDVYSCVHASNDIKYNATNATFYEAEANDYVDFDDLTGCVLVFLNHFCNYRKLDLYHAEN